MHFPLMNLRHLDFSPPDMEKFPCLRLAYVAIEAGGAKTIALNAADEVAVSAFLDGRIGFHEIPLVIEEVLSETHTGKIESIVEVLQADAEARRVAENRVSHSARGVLPVSAAVQGE
jgi:1-deoxy-D-xylulose-5-phosphate reductoisomerase